MLKAQSRLLRVIISFRFNMLLIQQPVTTKLFKKWSRISKRKGGYILVCTITH
nr:hypothetical protein CBIHECMJ_00130 [Klebsiella pneumoniae]WOL80588.1 hypothetical protein FEJLJNBH_00130 [Enterobacter hormaechei subsp. steigerwaltii]WOL81768.1 hypothetical protein KJCIIEAJ_00130 [Escherichia coli]WOL82201.1 hypothetical protein CBKDIOPN_00130 [Klebsiella oxytoca]WOL80718.1 hypothetical protein MDFLPAEK_00127 [Klebsiella pneumoniae]